MSALTLWRGPALVAVALTGLLGGGLPAAQATGSTYYLDCGATANGDGSQASPFNSLGAVNALTLNPGDSVLLRRGATCLGTLAPHGSGSSTAPISVGAYGTGALPAVNANGQTQAVLLEGEQHIQVSDLDVSAPGDNTTTRRGVYVHAQDAGTLTGITLQRLVVHDVRGLLPTSSNLALGKYGNASGGIVVEAAGSTTPTSFAELSIVDNWVHGVDRQGIYIWSNWCERPLLASFWYGKLCTAAWTPITGLVVRGNRLWDVGGDGIAPMTTTGALVEHNTLEGFNLRGSGNNAGMWTANSDNAVFQHNDTAGGHGTGDSMAYDVDHSTDGVVFQYNVSHDNQGGFVMACPADTGNRNWIVRYNISVHDNARMYEHGCGGPISNGQMYNNSVLIADGATVNLFADNATSGQDVHFTNNVISKQGSTGTITDTLTDHTFTLDHNTFYNVAAPSWATNTSTAAPLFAAHDLDDPYGYQVLAGSPVINAGTTISGNGGHDYFGNAVPATGAPSTGAYQGAAVCAPTLLDRFDGDTAGSAPAGWTVSGPTGAITVGTDPGPGFLGNSVRLATGSGTATADHAFPASATDLRVDARLRADQVTAPLGLHVLDGAGATVGGVSLAADGQVAYLDNGGWRDSALAYPTSAWHRVALVLHPSAGSYDVTVDDVPLVTAALTAGTGSPAQVRLRLPGGGSGGFAADDVLVEPLTC